MASSRTAPPVVKGSLIRPDDGDGEVGKDDDDDGDDNNDGSTAVVRSARQRRAAAGFWLLIEQRAQIAPVVKCTDMAGVCAVSPCASHAYV